MAIDCEQTPDIVGDYLEGELDSDLKAGLEDHLDNCPQCTEFVDSYRHTGCVCRRALSITMPTSAQATLLEFLRAQLHSPNS